MIFNHFRLLKNVPIGRTVIPEVPMADEKKSVEDEMSDDDLDQIIQDISKEETEEEVEAPAKAAAPAPATVASNVSTLGVRTAKKPLAAVKAEQSLNLELTGVINLKLCFSSGERSIEVLCTEDALICRMADGTEFRIPTGIEKKRQAA
jgi:hypothetical protein